MIYLRARKLRSGMFSLYLDYYSKGKRKQERLEIYVSQDYYSGERKRIANKDKPFLLIAEQKLHDARLSLAMNGNIDEMEIPQPFSIFNGLDCPKYILDKITTFFKNDWKDFNLGRMEEFRRMLNTMLSNASTNLYFNKLSSMLEYAVKREFIPKNYALLLDKLPNDAKKKIPFTLDDVKKIIHVDYNQHQEVKALAIVGLFTGLRYGDIAKLKVCAIKDTYLEMAATEKTEARIHIPLPQQVRVFIDKVRGSDYVFPNLMDVTPSNYNIKLKAMCNFMGIIHPNPTSHVFRHTFATLMRNIVKTDMGTISEMLTHSSVDMTKVYVHEEVEIVPGHQKAIDALVNHIFV